MIESTMPTGDTGLLIVQDNTDGPDKTVDLYIQSTSTKAIPQLPWSYSIDGVAAPLRTFNFTDTVLRQHIGLIYVGYAEEFVFHLDNTNTTQMGGPTDFTVELNQAGVKLVSILVGNVWKKAIPYVNVGGTWKTAAAYVMSGSVWKEAT